MKQNTRGFTLIELLVVIAIIGILTSVVLASLNSARAKGADAAVKENMTQLRSQAELFYDQNNNYGADVQTNDCSAGMFAETTFQNVAAELTRISGAPTCLSDDGDAVAGTQAESWAVSAPLKTDTALFWCIDSTGVATSTATGAVIDGNNNAVCQ